MGWDVARQPAKSHTVQTQGSDKKLCAVSGLAKASVPANMAPVGVLLIAATQ